MREHAALVCFLVPGLKVRLIDKRCTRTGAEEFVAKGGLADLVAMHPGATITDVITLHGTGTFEEKVPVDGQDDRWSSGRCTVDVALRWTNGFDSRIDSFVNTIPTPDGGTHVAGFDRALTKVCNELLVPNNRKLAKLAKAGNDRAEKADVQEGLVAAVKVTLPEPQFKGQTKQELGTPAVQSIVYEVVRTGFTNWLEGGGRKTHINALRDKVTSGHRHPGIGQGRTGRSAQGRDPDLGRTPGQVGRLPQARSRRRVAHRRGRLRRRTRQGGPQRGDDGRAAAARQGRQRVEVLHEAGD